ncbi:WHG domain-containing protein [Mycobacterium sp. M1]|uniref:WHG domain-containing protein n=1 Tax=Mycolicibacter acidiphilus TaxID=2835306 RepID=A0ABS5RG60_9MYCO|nr:TetR/AcrR family transcriptional regulator [Mycolicibacter acidiphilus]MBS9533272.1 WHG domain-containing protein [Mycolicibacter acidiphilus]
MTESTRPYHHGDLVRAAIDGAVDEVVGVGVAAVSMRRVARRAGVSHAALAYQFGDKTGLFTAVAAEGYRLFAEFVGTVAEEAGTAGFLAGGRAYVQFALAHPGHFEVMFRPHLYRADDADLTVARDAAFAVLYGSARTSLAAHRQADASDDDVLGLAMAGWSLSHGFATLLLGGNLPDRIQQDPGAAAALLVKGAFMLGELQPR